jgi:phospholipid/cholesterol/gamma-HCH transport system substrate-binding protein
LRDVQLAARNARDITDEVKSGQGVLGRLVYDNELGDRFDRISRDVAQITGKVRRGEGTLGKLIQDDVLYADLRESLRALTAGAGDARENAPILTFAAFLFSGF